jgi:hypothetical protein
VADITDSVDVVYGAFVVLSGEDFAVLGNFDANIFKTDIFGLGTSSNSKENSVECVFDLLLALFVGDYFFSFGIEFNAGRDGLLDELDPSFLHVISNFVGKLLVKTSQENRSDHDGDFAPDSV